MSWEGSMSEAGLTAYSTQSCLKIKTMSQQELLPDSWIVEKGGTSKICITYWYNYILVSMQINIGGHTNMEIIVHQNKLSVYNKIHFWEKCFIALIIIIYVMNPISQN